MANVPNTAPSGGAHRAEDRMIVRLPHDTTLAYFRPRQLGVHVPMIQPGLVDGNNDWLMIGRREGLIHVANLVANLTAD